jgi:hypothetical protein
MRILSSEHADVIRKQIVDEHLMPTYERFGSGVYEAHFEINGIRYDFTKYEGLSSVCYVEVIEEEV